jgi:hypothetical protein
VCIYVCMYMYVDCVRVYTGPPPHSIPYFRRENILSTNPAKPTPINQPTNHQSTDHLLTDNQPWQLSYITLPYTTGFNSLEELTDAAVPKHIRLKEAVQLEPAKSESEALAELKRIASRNKVGGCRCWGGVEVCVCVCVCRMPQTRP